MRQEIKDGLANEHILCSRQFGNLLVQEISGSKRPKTLIRSIFKELENNNLLIYLLPLSDYLKAQDLPIETCLTCDSWYFHHESKNVNDKLEMTLSIRGKRCNPKRNQAGLVSACEYCDKFRLKTDCE